MGSHPLSQPGHPPVLRGQLRLEGRCVGMGRCLVPRGHYTKTWVHAGQLLGSGRMNRWKMFLQLYLQSIG